METGRNVIYLVRHGESRGNVERTLLSADQDTLTPEGILQAKRLGKHLSETKFSRAVSSDFRRAFDTASLILAESEHAGLALDTDPRIRERDYGELEGKPYREGFRRYQQAKLDDGITSILDFNFGGENVDHVGDRMVNFLKDLVFETLDRSALPETVLIVSHSFALITLMSRLSRTVSPFTLSNWDPETDFKVMKNATYMRILVEGKPDSQLSRPRDLYFDLKHVSTEAASAATGSFSAFTKVTDDAKEFSGCVHQ